MAKIVFHNKRKNRVNSEKLFEFENFRIPDTTRKALSGAFRDNIRVFLQKFAEIEDYTVNGMPVWCTSLFSEEGVFPLYTVQETVQNSLDPFCDHCRLSGWGHHFVCKRKYHFIIPAKENWNEPLERAFAEIDTHVLYGLVHCNGYGHLICIYGLKNNSKFFTADDSMEFWDCLCSVLKARNISTGTVPVKDMIELSLIHGIAYGKAWFEKWGYRFSSGNSPITEQKYDAALRFLSSLCLDKIVSDFKNKGYRKRIKEMIEMYRKFSENPLVTISDLLRFMLALESRIPMDISNAGRFNSDTGESPMGFKRFVDSMTRDCRWSAKRLENVLFVIVDLLKNHKVYNGERERGMSRQELRDEARKSIGDTGLIDFVLKSIKCFAVDNQIICRATNPFSRLAEFTILDVPRGMANKLGYSSDVWFIYVHVVLEYREAKVVMNSNNQFVKQWPPKGDVVKQSMELICKVLPSFDEMETELTRPLSPGEVVVVEPWITVHDLKVAAQCALRDTYCVMDEFEVTQIGGLRKIEDEKVVNGTVEPGGQVWVRGRGLDLCTRLRYEDGSHSVAA
ncbi:PHD Zn-finger protein [Handroanthus impetiginosus]|uniref:PHD Zn-finger protein n=1 Tax=Handroanthus impetiginosus TaxID=429701 RepID=A0A2G9I5D6_9LAMI|nr:PHD Zn-finger protein [Handroanthus impetiginosus]